jgi:hypothetical protein
MDLYRCKVSTGSWVLNRPEADLWPSKIGRDLNETSVGYHRFVDGRPTWYSVYAAPTHTHTRHTRHTRHTHARTHGTHTHEAGHHTMHWSLIKT